MANVLRAGQLSVLPPDIRQLFASGDDPMHVIDTRASALFPHTAYVIWECDACSFQFSYVSQSAVALLGYPVEDWLRPMFWAEHIVHEDDRDDAVTYCALATGKARDHMFEYRARTADGRTVWLRDYVRVVTALTGGAARLRGIMFDVTTEKAHDAIAARAPSREELVA